MYKIYSFTKPLILDVLSSLYVPVDSLQSPLEFFFQEQSYSSLHSGWSLAWDIDDSCGAIADFCGFVADFCGVVTDPCGAFAIGDREGVDAATAFVARLAKHHKTLLSIVKHHETNVKHCETS